MKTRVAMLFGGKSVEHEVSVISGIQAVMNMDTDKYEVIPVYMTKRNEMTSVRRSAKSNPIKISMNC